ncbi:MAG TPA: hypothetical protein VL443_21905 [Cyclobacteriaceae bacterium]|jgi:hypothetical protein|nr:hypothetical protein [Cyclobacteriaceae bacterium]
MNRFLLVLFLLISSIGAYSQVLTHEDSLSAGLIRSNNITVISGYGQVKVQYDANYKTATANLTRNVLFLGHKFNNNVFFFSEMEIENAKVTNGNPAGEISMEQLFVKFNINRDLYLQAGLFIPRIGIINENHLPTTFNGNDRTFVETYIIPSTWREVGVGLYGNMRAIPGLNYSFAVVNGLNSKGFVNGLGIREGRQEGSNATASNLAITGALLYYRGNWRLQTSGYYGGSAGLTKRVADSLQLQSGPFGTPVSLVEANVQYHNNGISFKALATTVSVSNAFEINRAYANNTPSQMVGAYAELGYNFYRLIDRTSQKNFTVFGRLEYLDMNYKIPVNGIKNGINKQYYTVVGITFKPVSGVIVKADYVLKTTGERNKELIVTQFPQQLPYYTSSGYFNIGLGYSF